MVRGGCRGQVESSLPRGGWGRCLVLACGVLLLATAGCAGFRNPFAPIGPPAPHVLRPGASLEEVIAAVNENSGRIHSYAANGATITPLGMPGVPSLSGSILIERPSRFRVNAGTALTGPVIDLGSNEQLLWMWIRDSEPRGVYVCRRDQFGSSGAQQVMPVNPDWLPSALGMVEFEPHGQHQMRLLPDGNLEVSSTVPGPSGPLTRLCVIDPTRAWVLQQHAYNATGEPVATAVATQHRYFPEQQVSLPQRVEVRLPPAGLAMTIDVGQVALNTPLGDPGRLWLPPQIDGYPQIDICGTGSAGGSTNADPSSTPPPLGVQEADAGYGQQPVATPFSDNEGRPLSITPEQTWEPVHRVRL